MKTRQFKTISEIVKLTNRSYAFINDNILKGISKNQDGYFVVPEEIISKFTKRNKTNNTTLTKSYKDSEEYKSLSAGQKAWYTRQREIKAKARHFAMAIEMPQRSISFRTADGATLSFIGKITNIKIDGKKIKN